MIASLRTYPRMKDSGEPWLGEVPQHWDVLRLKYSAELINEKVNGATSELPYTGLEHIESWTGKCVTTDAETSSDGQASVHRAGDVLFGKLRPYLAKAYAAQGDGICTGELLVLRPKTLVQGFLRDYLLNPSFISIVDSSTYGTKMPRASWDFIGNLPALVPPLDEQRAIVAFLNRGTMRIDALIEKKRRQTELLHEKRAALISHAVTKGLDPSVRMKDSGIEWLGGVPAQWEMKRLKFVSALQTGLTLGKRYADHELVARPYLRVANVQDGYLDLETITEVELPPEEATRYELQPGDVLMTEGGDFDKLGRGHVWEGQILGCLHQNHIFAVRPNARALIPHFLAAVLTSSHGKNYFTSTSQQTTNLATTNSTKLGSFPVPLPPVAEQSLILERVKKDSEHLDRLIGKVHLSIQRLCEYRTALISAAVTGKLDVRKEVA